MRMRGIVRGGPAMNSSARRLSKKDMEKQSLLIGIGEYESFADGARLLPITVFIGNRQVKRSISAEPGRKPSTR